LVESGAARRVETGDELIEETRRLLNDSTLRLEMVGAAIRVILPHRGATARTAALINEAIKKGALAYNSNGDLQRQSAS